MDDRNCGFGAGKKNRGGERRKKVVDMNDVWPGAVDRFPHELFAMRRIDRVERRRDPAQNALDVVIVDVEPSHSVPARGEQGGFSGDDSIFAARLLVTVVSNQNPHPFLLAELLVGESFTARLLIAVRSPGLDREVIILNVRG
jgi:hypothetical protein